MLDKDIAELMGIVPNDFNEPVIRGGAFDDVKDQTSPFGFQKCEGRWANEALALIVHRRINTKSYYIKNGRDHC